MARTRRTWSEERFPDTRRGAFEEGKHVQAFPECGAERQGAPIRAYNRVSAFPIRRRCGVQNPNIVVVVAPTMVESANPTEGTTDDAVYLANSAEDAK